MKQFCSDLNNLIILKCTVIQVHRLYCIRVIFYILVKELNPTVTKIYANLEAVNYNVTTKFLLN